MEEIIELQENLLKMLIIELHETLSRGKIVMLQRAITEARATLTTLKYINYET